jgi:hypothetical protein
MEKTMTWQEYFKKSIQEVEVLILAVRESANCLKQKVKVEQDKIQSTMHIRRISRI